MIPSEIFIKWIAKPLTAVQSHTKLIWAATLSTANFLLQNFGLYINDLNRIKEAKIEEIEAETDKKVLEAAEIANRISLSQCNQAIAEIEQLANAQKILNEAKKIKSKTITKKIKKIHIKQTSEAKAVINKAHDRIKKAPERLFIALKQLHKEGGEFYVDRKQLEEMLQRGLPPELDGYKDEENKENESKKKTKFIKTRKKKKE